jgi:hypothetical protein
VVIAAAKWHTLDVGLVAKWQLYNSSDGHPDDGSKCMHVSHMYLIDIEVNGL